MESVANQIVVYQPNETVRLDVRLSILGVKFRQWATGILKDYLLRGHAVNARLNQLEDKMDRRLAKTEADVACLKDKVDFFVQTKEPPLQGVFYQGRFWDAKSLLMKFIRRKTRAASPSPLQGWARRLSPDSSIRSARRRRRAGNMAMEIALG